MEVNGYPKVFFSSIIFEFWSALGQERTQDNIKVFSNKKIFFSLNYYLLYQPKSCLICKTSSNFFYETYPIKLQLPHTLYKTYLQGFGPTEKE